MIKNVLKVLRNIFAYKLMDSGLVMDLKRLRYKMVGHSHTSKCGIHHKNEEVITQCLRKCGVGPKIERLSAESIRRSGFLYTH